jgi:hypothetical protein
MPLPHQERFSSSSTPVCTSTSKYSVSYFGQCSSSENDTPFQDEVALSLPIFLIHPSNTSLWVQCSSWLGLGCPLCAHLSFLEVALSLLISAFRPHLSSLSGTPLQAGVHILSNENSKKLLIQHTGPDGVLSICSHITM